MSPGSDSQFDYIVVGGGSAGSVMAARLSELPENKVLLIEAGPRDWNPMIHMLTGEIFMVGSSADWQFKSEPEAQLGGYQVPLPRGRVLGGSSSINGQVYCRGHHRDYDERRQLGNGWAGIGRRCRPTSGRPRNRAGVAQVNSEGGQRPSRTTFGRYNNGLLLARSVEAAAVRKLPLQPRLQRGLSRKGLPSRTVHPYP